MRKVTLYQITAMDMMAGNYVELTGLMPSRLTRFSSTEAMTPVDFTADTVRVPVHHIRRCEPGMVNEEAYIAIAPRLSEVLEAPFKAEVDRAWNSARSAREVAALYEWRIVEFNSKPWYKRMLAALDGINECRPNSSGII